jgi:hypothetical protein
MNNFLPSAVKFHYQFNLREMSNVTQGLCRMIKEQYREPVKVCRAVGRVCGVLVTCLQHVAHRTHFYYSVMRRTWHICVCACACYSQLST